MDAITMELDETPLKLEVLIDPKTKCATMNTTHTLTKSPMKNSINSFISKDPLQKDDAAEPDFEKMSDLDKLIYSERQRLLQNKKPIKPTTTSKKAKSNNGKYSDASSDDSDMDSLRGLKKLERQRIRQRLRRARESDEERDYRRLRERIGTLKRRLLERLKNFDDESYWEDLKKQNTEKKRQQRLEQRLNETAEEREERKTQYNMKNRKAKFRRRALMTPEDLMREREKKTVSLKKCLGKMSKDELQNYHQKYREQSRKRYRENNRERKKFDLILQGKSIEEIEAMEDDVKFKKNPKKNIK